MSADTVTVYVVAGLDPQGHVVELGKFFDAVPAQEHRAKFGLTSKWRDVGVIIREEPKSAQHPAHWEHIGYKPKGA